MARNAIEAELHPRTDVRETINNHGWCAMPTQCSSTANSITEVLLAGDAVLNLTQQPLNAAIGTLFVSASGDRLALSHSATSVYWKQFHSELLPGIMSGEVARLVIVSEENCSDAECVVRDLFTRGIPHLHCTLMNSCDADAFMDEVDTEAVTERLRQLGYI